MLRIFLKKRKTQLRENMPFFAKFLLFAKILNCIFVETLVSRKQKSKQEKEKIMAK